MKRFIHIPKNGGMAVTKWLEDNSIPFVLGLGKVQSTGRFKYKKVHETASFFNDDFPSFAVVRNPYSRFFSYYTYNYKHGESLGWRYSFSDFVNNSLELAPIDIMKAGNKWQLQKKYMFDGDRCLVEKILRFENLENDLQEYFNNNAPLEKINSSSDNLSIEELYTDELKDKIYNFFREDFLTFGYKK